jgi:hypothetical protein
VTRVEPAAAGRKIPCQPGVWIVGDPAWLGGDRSSNLCPDLDVQIIDREMTFSLGRLTTRRTN